MKRQKHCAGTKNNTDENVGRGHQFIWHIMESDHSKRVSVQVEKKSGKNERDRVQHRCSKIKNSG